MKTQRRTDIEVRIQKASITILSKDNQLTFPADKGAEMNMFITPAFTMSVLDDLEKAGIVKVNCYNHDGSCGYVSMTKKFGYDNEKFTDLLVFLMEKYNL
jgi:hypothetical protein